MDAILLFNGKVVTYQGFKQAGPNQLRIITETEFRAAAQTLEENGYGIFIEERVPRSYAKMKLFLKLSPLRLQNKKENVTVDIEKYERKYAMKLHSSIRGNLINILLEKNLIEGQNDQYSYNVHFDSPRLICGPHLFIIGPIKARTAIISLTRAI